MYTYFNQKKEKKKTGRIFWGLSKYITFQALSLIFLMFLLKYCSKFHTQIGFKGCLRDTRVIRAVIYENIGIIEIVISIYIFFNLKPFNYLYS